MSIGAVAAIVFIILDVTGVYSTSWWVIAGLFAAYYASYRLTKAVITRAKLSNQQPKVR